MAGNFKEFVSPASPTDTAYVLVSTSNMLQEPKSTVLTTFLWHIVCQSEMQVRYQCYALNISAHSCTAKHGSTQHSTAQQITASIVYMAYL